MNTETARKAAKWWADHLRGSAILDNGDNSPENVTARGIAPMLQAKEKAGQTPTQIDSFESELAKLLSGLDRSYVSFGVDYNPDRILEESAQAAGLQLGMTTLPWKTQMYIEGEVVTVREGYRAGPVTLP